mgnify:CR=1 FL=1
MIEPFWIKLFVGYLLVGSAAAIVYDFCNGRILKAIKRDNPKLYEDIRQGYDEGWTKPGGIVSHIGDRPMASRLHKAILDRKCMEQMNEGLYWTYRISGWISAPVLYVFLSFCVWFIYTAIQIR